MAILRPGKAMSGFPGTFHSRRYPVRPAARRRWRTSSSGLVLARLLPFMDFFIAARRRTSSRSSAERSEVSMPSSRPGLGRFLLRRLGARLGLVAGLSAVLGTASSAELVSSRSSFSSIRASMSPLSAGIHSTVASEVRGIQRISSWRSCFWGSSDSLASEQ